MLKKNYFRFVVKGRFVIYSPVVHHCCYPFDIFFKSGYVLSIVFKKYSAVVCEGLAFDSVGVQKDKKVIYEEVPEKWGKNGALRG